MSVIYELDWELGLIRTRCTGDVTFAEVMDHFLELEQEPSLPTPLDVLLDLTETLSIPDSQQISSVASQVEILNQRIEWGACAVVVSHDVLFGMSRMFHVLADEQFTDANVFRDPGEAERWLVAHGTPRG